MANIEKSVWVVRADRGHGADFAVENKCAVIDFPEFEDMSKFGNREEMKDHLRRKIRDITERNIGGYAGQCYRFSREIRRGDLVIVPFVSARGVVAVGKIIGDYRYESKAEEEWLRHRLPVEWENASFPRRALPEVIRKGLFSQMTVSQISDKNAFHLLREAVAKGGESVDESDNADSEETQENLEDMADDRIARLIERNFHGYRMEDLIAAILKAKGFYCELSPKGGDGGVDIMVADGKGFGKTEFAVQVKSGKTPATVKMLEEFQSALETRFGAKTGLFVSWSGFAFSQQEVCMRFCKMRLWQSDEVLKFVKTHYHDLPAEIRRDLPLKQIWTVVESADE